MISEFEESEFRAPLFNQLEKGGYLLWEPGQVFENKIGIDRASFCLHDYLWKLHGFPSPLGGTILSNRTFPYLWGSARPNKALPNFKLNLFVQAKRSTYSSRRNNNLLPYIPGRYWYFEITPHQQSALELLEQNLNGDALVIYAAPLFHKQQDLYNNTINQTIVNNSTFPKASTLRGHTKWYYNTSGIIGVANPEFNFIEEDNLFSQIEKKREDRKGDDDRDWTDNLQKLATSIQNVVRSQSESFQASQFAYYSDLIDNQINNFDLQNTKGIKEYMQIETFAFLWKLNWLTF